MPNTDIDVLNDVTKALIDSQKGYEKAVEMVDDSVEFSTELNRRAAERAGLVNELQSHVRQLGGDPETSGSMMGQVHRGFTDFSSMFQDDKKAAFGAIDDGEEHLTDKIEDKVGSDEITPQTKALLMRAHALAKSGARFADRVEDALDE